MGSDKQRLADQCVHNTGLMGLHSSSLVTMTVIFTFLTLLRNQGNKISG